MHSLNNVNNTIDIITSINDLQPSTTISNQLPGQFVSTQINIIEA